MRILIVDDSQKDRLFFKNVLHEAGFEDTVYVDSADQAFAILKLRQPETDPPEIDLILMDIGMPGLNGIEALKKIRAVHHLKDIPVIMVTSELNDKNLIQAFESGATDLIKKPMNKIELLVRMGAALRLKRETDRRKTHEKELRKANQRLERLSSLDGLTQIANRRRFDEHMEQEWRRAIRTGQPMGLVMADIDHFKAFNDTYGHQAGDDCLIQVAQRLYHLLKRPADLVARYGGEEFAIILPETEIAGAGDLAEQMRRSIKDLKIKHSSSPVARVVTISLGVSCALPTASIEPEELISQADRALYQAKNQGRNQVVLWSGTEPAA